MKIKLAIMLSFFIGQVSCDNTYIVFHFYGITSDHVDKIINPIKTISFNTGSWFKHNKLIGGSAAVVSAYSYLFYKLTDYYKPLSNENSWANWQANVSLNDVLKKQQKDLFAELYNKILERYNTDNQNNLLEPLVNFNNDIDKEISQLQMYLKISKIIKTLRLQKIFAIDDRRNQLVEEHLNKLIYLKNTATAWVQLTTKRMLTRS